jgi:hypothetical protein
MVHLSQARVLDTQWVSELFEQHGDEHYARDLLFSTAVDVISMVALESSPSVSGCDQVHGQGAWAFISIV